MRLMGLKPGVIAVTAFCLTPQAYAPPLNMATGPDPNVDGYLRVGADEYGSWLSPGFDGAMLGDAYNPVGLDAGGLGPLETTFTNGFMMFVPATGEKALLSTSAIWQGVCGISTLGIAVVTANVGFDTNADGVPDRLTSTFSITGTGVSLLVDVEQTVVKVSGNSMALLTQTYTITNQLANVSFNLVRIGDFDLVYLGSGFADDSVGTDRAFTNNSVFQQEDGTPATRITMVSAEAVDYTGGIQGIEPTGGPPAYGFGTDCQTWDNAGLPATWADEIATIGNKINGESGNQGADAHVELNIPVVDLQNGASVTIKIRHLAGSACLWDCEALPDGKIGITDFLRLLADWNGPSACDFDGGGVGITDFLELLANWGPCPEEAPPASDCCVAHATPGCDDAVCEAFVCANFNPQCCSLQWLQPCADFANLNCAACQ